MRRCSGFTLVELMVTVAVIAVLAGVAVAYTLSNLPTYRVNGAARQLMGDFRLAKTEAVKRNLRVLVQFDPGAGDYTLAYDVNGSNDLDSPPDEVIKTVHLSELYSGIGFATYSGGVNQNGDPLPDDGVSFQDNLAGFSPTGGARPGAAYVVPEKDTGARSTREREVSVTVTTGRARLYRWTGSTWK